MQRKSISKLFSQKKKSVKRILVSVCEWCPKGNYPVLKGGEEYTHGMCRKHYKQLSIKKNLPVSFLIAELIETTYNTLDVKTRKTYVALFSFSKKYLMQLKTSILSA